MKFINTLIAHRYLRNYIYATTCYATLASSHCSFVRAITRRFITHFFAHFAVLSIDYYIDYIIIYSFNLLINCDFIVNLDISSSTPCAYLIIFIFFLLNFRLTVSLKVLLYCSGNEATHFDLVLIMTTGIDTVSTD